MTNNIETLAVVYFEKTVFGLAIFNGEYTVIEYIVDDFMGTKLKKFVLRFKINSIFTHSDIDTNTQQILYSMQNISTQFLPKTKFTYKYLTSYPCLGIKAFNALTSITKHYNWTEVFPSDKIHNKHLHNVIAYFNSCPVNYFENTNRLVMTKTTITNLNQLTQKLKLMCVTELGCYKIKNIVQYPFVKTTKIEQKENFYKNIQTNCDILYAHLQKLRKIKNIHSICNKEDVNVLCTTVKDINEISKSFYTINNLSVIDEIQAQINTTEAFEHEHFTKQLEETLNTHASDLSQTLEIDLAIIFIPQIGFLIESNQLDDISTTLLSNTCNSKQSNIRNSIKNNSIRNNNNSTFEYKNKEITRLFFKIYDKYYYKTRETNKLDRQYGDITEFNYTQSLILKKQIKHIMMNSNILSILEYISEIDAYVSLARNIKKIKTQQEQSVASVGQSVILRQCGIIRNSSNYTQLHCVCTRTTVKSKFKTFCMNTSTMIQNIEKSKKSKGNSKILVLVEFNLHMSTEKDLLAFYKGIKRYMSEMGYTHYIL